MAETLTTGPAVAPADVNEMLQRGNAGDLSVLPVLKQFYEDNPDFRRSLGDLAAHAEHSLLNLAAGASLVAREAIKQQLAELRAKLTSASASEAEKLLVQRVAINWLEVYYGDVDLAARVAAGRGDAPSSKAAERRLDRAHARFLASVKALAAVQKLLRPAVSPYELAMRPPATKAAGQEGAVAVKRQVAVPVN